MGGLDDDPVEVFLLQGVVIMEDDEHICGDGMLTYN